MELATASSRRRGLIPMQSESTSHSGLDRRRRPGARSAQPQARGRLAGSRCGAGAGCQIEKLQIETLRRLGNAITTCCIVAWRVLHLTYVARENPDAPATLVFTDAEWKGIYLANYRKKFTAGMDMPTEPPKLSTEVIWLARLGGYLARKDDGMPDVGPLARLSACRDLHCRLDGCSSQAGSL